MIVIMPDQTTRALDTNPGTARALLAVLGINPLEVIVVRNNVLIPESAPIRDDDEIRIIRIAHGG
jgi:sulfur carrier protein ThiS